MGRADVFGPKPSCCGCLVAIVHSTAKARLRASSALRTSWSEFPELRQLPDSQLRRRDGFELTDPRMDRTEYLREIDYCIIAIRVKRIRVPAA